MTVESQTSRADYTGNGSTTVFTVPFYFLANSHVLVIRTVIATGAATTLSEGADYSLTGAGVSSGGTVTTTSAPTSLQKISILRNVPLTQLVDYVENDPFPAASHEKALDQLTMEIQQVNESMSRSIKLSATNTITSTEFTVPATARANKVLGFDSAGELTVAQGIGDYRGNWAAARYYNARDMVKDGSNNNLYICNTAHLSSGATPISTNTDSTKWDILVDVVAATTSASNAATSATNAAASASAASTSASNAATSATNAATSATNANTKYTQFNNQYQGSFASDPATRPDSSALQSGDLYFNTTISGIKAFSGTGWVVAYNTGGGSSLIASNNLSDLPNAGTARTNLGLGALATVTPGTGVATAAANAINASGGFITFATYAPASGKVLTVSNTLTLAGTDGTTMTFPAASDTVAALATVQSFTKAQRGAVTALSNASATVAVDMSASNNFSLTTGSVNHTLGSPTNMTAGQSGVIVITQGATARTMAFNSEWKFPGGTAPTLTATASAVDVIVYYVESATRISARMVNDVK